MYLFSTYLSTFCITINLLLHTTSLISQPNLSKKMKQVSFLTLQIVIMALLFVSVMLISAEVDPNCFQNCMADCGLSMGNPSICIKLCKEWCTYWDYCSLTWPKSKYIVVRYMYIWISSMYFVFFYLYSIWYLMMLIKRMAGCGRNK